MRRSSSSSVPLLTHAAGLAATVEPLPQQARVFSRRAGKVAFQARIALREVVAKNAFIRFAILQAIGLLLGAEEQ